MFKKLFFFIALIFFLRAPEVFAEGNSFVSIVNPVRGQEFWEQSLQPSDVVKSQLAVLEEVSLPATWLIRFDALADPQVINVMKQTQATHEKGLFLEITPGFAKSSGVVYQKSESWHQAGSVFLSGYSTADREKLVDTAFEEFKQVFGFYPKSVGSWWIDSYSLSYMESKYKISGALIVADQYNTDNYQIWGQYWSTPYYPSKRNNLIPAQSPEGKVPVVIMQWAGRDPFNGYGSGVQESTYSVQANDYLDYHNLDINYFSRLVDIYTTQSLNSFGHIVVGLENSYPFEKYKDEYRKQLTALKSKQTSGQLQVVSMGNFASWYMNKFPNLSPEHIIVAGNPLGGEYKAVWFMNPYYRAGWFFNKDGSVFRDIRQYVEGQTEPCFDKLCKEINFATFSTRVLDDVTYNQKLILDQGKISGVHIKKVGENYVLTYKNETGKEKKVEFMPRDISIDGKVKTIDGLILDTVTKLKEDIGSGNYEVLEKKPIIEENLIGFALKITQFLMFTIIGLFIPGFLLVRSLKQKSLPFNIFISLCAGMVLFTLVLFTAGYLRIPWIVFVYVIGGLAIFFYKKIYREINIRLPGLQLLKGLIPAVVIIILGTFFQTFSSVRSGWAYDFGIGFWGPLGHDGIWHQALINQLIKNVPPQNPAFSGHGLSNYHYFYDLMVAGTVRLTQIPVMDLVYRFYPVLFSLLLGVGTYLFVKKVFSSKVVLPALYFVYFAGSFGWVVDLLKGREWGGESAFWVNQPVSMNLNPPFAISLIIIIAVILILQLGKMGRGWSSSALLVILIGALIEFKVYGGVILLGSLFLVGLYNLAINRDFWYLKIFSGSLILSLIIFLPQNWGAGNLLIFTPFWFIHSMVDFSDRVGWERLSQARMAYADRGDWLKFILAEGLALFIFIAGNLGTRFIAIFMAGKLMNKNLWKESWVMMVLIMFIASISIPIFFTQKGNMWNTIQFFYYGLFFAAVLAGAVVVHLYKKLSGKALVLLILILTPISAVTTFKNGFYNTPPSRLTYGEAEALNFLKSLPEGGVLTYPFNKNLRAGLEDPFPLYTYETTSYVSAFSAKTTFIEDEIQQEILQEDYKKRLVAVNDFFAGRDIIWMKQFLLENNIKYIYILSSVNIPVDHEKLNVKQVFENKEAKVFEVLAPI